VRRAADGREYKKEAQVRRAADGRFRREIQGNKMEDDPEGSHKMNK
jgi:hypothetical protein